MFIPKEDLTLDNEEKEKVEPKRTAFYLVLFALTILMVFRVIPYYICLPIILVSILATDRNALSKVDYPLLLTFVCFFLLAGNISRIEAVSAFFSSLLEKNTLLTSILSC